MRFFAWLIAALTFLAYPLVAFWPYEFTEAFVVNHVERGSLGGWSFPERGIVHTDGPPEWVEKAIGTHAIDVDLRVRPSSLEQEGPARIFTVSYDADYRNVSVDQQGDGLIIRLRTEGRDHNGQPAFEVPGVFDSDDWIDIRLWIRNAKLHVDVDDERVLTEWLQLNPLRRWEPSFHLALGNDLSWDRPWLGDIDRATVTVGGRTHDYVTDPTLLTPPWFFRNQRPPGVAPYTYVERDDLLINLFGFIPLGVVFGCWLRRRRWGYPTAVLLTGLTSLAIEIVQAFTPSRFPSLNDLVLNTLGGAIGVTIWYLAAAVRRAIVRRLPDPTD